MIKIAFINSVAGYGSTGRLIDELARMDGIEAKVYFGRKKNLSDHETYRMTGFFGNVHHAMRTFLFDDHAFCNTKETERMLKDLDQFHPDLIHLHNLHGYYINTEVLFEHLKEMNIPVIWTLHDCWAFTGHCAHYEAVGCDQWKNGCRHCKNLWTYYPTFNGNHTYDNYVRKKTAFTSLGNNLHIAVPSRWLKSQVEESFLKETECSVISNGIDLKKFYPVKSAFKEEHNIVGKKMIVSCSSVWTERKGLNQLEDISYQLPENCVMCVVGTTKKQSKRFSNKTICIERTDSIRKLAEIYSAGDLFVNLTMEETFSMVNVEAQACGCPVATYRSGGSTEMITENTGVIIPKNDIDGMLAVIRDVCADKLVFSETDCVENASCFSLEKMYDGYMKLYQRVIREKVCEN